MSHFKAPPKKNLGQHFLTDRNIIEQIVGKTPLARMGNPEDIANAYVFLSSDLAGFISGTVLSVDGGLVL
jgi:3-oxoacyl-[acyl-carrier protein] reductase